MNRLYTLSTICGLLLLINISCGPTATFENPQPEDVEAETTINKKLFGSYQSKDSSYTMVINTNMITIQRDSYTDIPLTALASSFSLIGDTLINNTDNTKKIVQRTDIAVIQHEVLTDTIFKFSEGYVLKKYLGHYFINTLDEETKKWDVSKLSLEKDQLTLSSIFGKVDIHLLNEITDTPEDTSQSTINYDISRKQFKKFLKSDGFRHIDTFIRVKN